MAQKRHAPILIVIVLVLALAELLSRHRGDRRVFLELDVPGKEKPLRVRSEVAVRVKPSERMVSEVEQLCGSGSVELR